MSLFLRLALLLLLPWAYWRFIRRRSSAVLRNIPGPKGSSWATGCLNDLINIKAWDYHLNIGKTYGSVARIKGLFGDDDLYIFDPKALHHVLVKDQHIYEETDSFIQGNKLLFGKGLLTSLGEEHRRQRKMLNPVFSIAHMREMVPIFYEITHKVRRVFLNKVKQGSQEVDVVNWMTRIALELIGQSGLGYSFDELTENSTQHEYAVAVKQLVPLQGKSNLLIINLSILPMLTRIGSPAFRRWVVERLPMKDVQHLREIIDKLWATSIQIIDEKRKALAEGDEAVAAQIGRGKDVISILMKANMHAAEDEKLCEEELIGQVTTLTFAATDTTSSALSRTFYLLAEHKDVQDKLREEIRTAKRENSGQDFNYDDLVSLPYLDAVCRETLRLHPPASTMMREACQDAILPLATPVKGIDGQEIYEIPIPKGTKIHMSILNSNRNPEFWGADAEEWKPERWLKPLPEALVNARVPGIYSHLMTFLGGGRSCIGFKFSQLEMKVVLALMLEDIEFSLSDKKIYWQMTGIATPNVDPTSIIPTLPMIISLAK